VDGLGRPVYVPVLGGHPNPPMTAPLAMAGTTAGGATSTSTTASTVPRQQPQPMPPPFPTFASNPIPPVASAPPVSLTQPLALSGSPPTSSASATSLRTHYHGRGGVQCSLSTHPPNLLFLLHTDAHAQRSLRDGKRGRPAPVGLISSITIRVPRRGRIPAPRFCLQRRLVPTFALFPLRTAYRYW